MQQIANDEETIALHESQDFIYQGRLRFKVFGWLAMIITPLIGWIMHPFDIARSRINDAKEIHIHSHIDVLAYRAIALAHLCLCDLAREALSEIDRLISILNDDARTRHWINQKRQIDNHCKET